MDQNSQQERATQEGKKRHLLEFHIADFDQRGISINRVVDNALGQFQRQIEQREQSTGYKQKDQLIAPGVLPDESEECAFYVIGPIKRLCWCLLAPQTRYRSQGND